LIDEAYASREMPVEKFLKLKDYLLLSEKEREE